MRPKQRGRGGARDRTRVTGARSRVVRATLDGMLDTLAIARTLTDAGMDEDQAAAVTAAVQQAAEHGDQVTRQDLDTLRTDMHSEIAQAVPP